MRDLQASQWRLAEQIWAFWNKSTTNPAGSMIGAQKSNQLSMLENCCISVVQDNLARPSLAKPKLQQV